MRWYIVCTFCILWLSIVWYLFIREKSEWTPTLSPISTNAVVTKGIIPIDSSSWSFDRLSFLKEKNLDVSNAITLWYNKNYTGAIEVLEKVKLTIDSPKDLSVLDYIISDNRFALDRIDWVMSYIALAKNINYPARTRALAMQKAYLMYKKYNDANILTTIINGMDISWTNSGQVIVDYMNISHNLYPLPNSGIFLMNKDISLATKKEDIYAIYIKHITEIENAITSMQKYSGELTEVTSAMLSLTNIKASLYRKYELISRSEVERDYKKLVQFDQEKQMYINQQYALLYYANFLASIEDFDAAQNILTILLEKSLYPALVESIPKYRDFPYIKSMTGVTDEKINNLINFIWSELPN